MIFKRILPTLVKLHNNKNKSLYIELITTISRPIYELNEKYYFDVFINDEFIHNFKTIIDECETYLNKEGLHLQYKSNISNNILKVKVIHKYDRFNLTILDKNDLFVPTKTLEQGMKVKVYLHLEYIWLNNCLWGLVWKCNTIYILDKLANHWYVDE